MSSITYYDDLSGRYRVKRRYIWATWAFVLGSFSGYAIALVGH